MVSLQGANKRQAQLSMILPTSEDTALTQMLMRVGISVSTWWLSTIFLPSTILLTVRTMFCTAAKRNMHNYGFRQNAHFRTPPYTSTRMSSSCLLLARSLAPARALSKIHVQTCTLTLNGLLDNDGPGLGRHFGNHPSAHLHSCAQLWLLPDAKLCESSSDQ
jgi:hypothetical protein